MAKTRTPKYTATIAALKDQEQSRWRIADSLHVEWQPSDTRTGQFKKADFESLANAMAKAGIPDALTYNTARQYRKVAANMPVADRFADISFTAHREALERTGYDHGAAVNALKTAANNSGGKSVTVAMVRSAIAGTQQGATSGQTGSGKVRTISVAVATDILSGLTVTDHYRPLDVADLESFQRLLVKTEAKLTKHLGVRKGANVTTGASSGKTRKTAKSAKSAKTAKAPVSARGN